MPTVLRSNGFRVTIYAPPREHGPPHVHVVRAGRKVVIELSPIRVRRISGMRDAEVSVAVRLVEQAHDYLMRKWKETHATETTDPS